MMYSLNVRGENCLFLIMLIIAKFINDFVIKSRVMSIDILIFFNRLYQF